MDEWLPVVLGCTWGLLAARRLALRAIIAGAVALGVLTSWINGELALTPWFAVVDTLLVGASAAVGVTLRHRRAVRALPPRRAAP
ncbi:MAG: hypothetical protein ACXW05_07300 [Gemmatirosa sp.]